jgi:transposase
MNLTVWAQDEGRLGLKPVERRVWARKGVRPVARQHPRYKWLYVYAFVRPVTGEQFYLVLPSVSTPWFSLALAEFAKHAGAGPESPVLLVLDGAGWHTAKDLVVPDGLHLLFLPPYSPQLQPAERLWPLFREALANRSFADLGELETVVQARCRWLQADQGNVRRLTHYHWWTEAESGID